MPEQHDPGRLLGPGEGEVLHMAGGAQNRVLVDGSTLGGRLGLVEVRMPPGFGKADTEAIGEVMARYATELYRG